MPGLARNCILDHWRDHYKEMTLAQLNIETGVPITDLEPLILFNVAYFLVAAINPGTGKFVNDDDVVW
jgi:hypothetical protein